MPADDDRSKQVARSFIIIWLLIAILIAGLSILVALAFMHTGKAIEDTNKRLDSFKLTQSVNDEKITTYYKKLNKEIEDILSKPRLEPKDGRDGKDGKKGDKGDAGKDGKRGPKGNIIRQIQFDGKGHWRFVSDHEWLNLFEVHDD